MAEVEGNVEPTLNSITLTAVSGEVDATAQPTLTSPNFAAVKPNCDSFEPCNEIIEENANACEPEWSDLESDSSLSETNADLQAAEQTFEDFAQMHSSQLKRNKTKRTPSSIIPRSVSLFKKRARSPKSSAFRLRLPGSVSPDKNNLPVQDPVTCSAGKSGSLPTTPIEEVDIHEVDSGTHETASRSRSLEFDSRATARSSPANGRKIKKRLFSPPEITLSAPYWPNKDKTDSDASVQTKTILSEDRVRSPQPSLSKLLKPVSANAFKLFQSKGYVNADEEFQWKATVSAIPYNW